MLAEPAPMWENGPERTSGEVWVRGALKHLTGSLLGVTRRWKDTLPLSDGRGGVESARLRASLPVPVSASKALRRTATPSPPRWAPTYCLCVGAVGPEGDGHGVEHAHLASHLLHSPHCALLVGVGKLDHQTG